MRNDNGSYGSLGRVGVRFILEVVVTVWVKNIGFELVYCSMNLV